MKRQFLFENGFGYVWVNHGVCNIKMFLGMLKERLIDCHWQRYNEHVTSSERFSVYALFRCDVSIIPHYLQADINSQFKYIMTRFRFGISDIYTHSYRYRSHSENDLLCPLCKGDKEDEYHFIMCCSFYENLREQFIPKKFYHTPSKFHFILLMSSRQDYIVRNLSLYVYKALQVRNIALSH